MYPGSFRIVTHSVSSRGLTGGLDKFQDMDGDIIDAVMTRGREVSANYGV